MIFLRHQRGFTLLEILVVLVIIGILSGVAAMSFVRADQETLKAEAARLQSTLRHAQDGAIFASEPRGLALYQNGYRLLRFDTQRYQWNALAGEKNYTLPKDLLLSLELEGTPLPLPPLAEKEKKAPFPAIVFSPQGELTPFSLKVAIAGNPQPGMVIRAAGLSDIVLERESKAR